MAEEKKQPKKNDSDRIRKNVNKVNDTALEDIQLKQTFEWYCIWRSLPPILINARERNKILTAEETCAKFGIDDEVISGLIGIKTQTQFAERYNVSKDTLTDWNKKIASRDVLADIRKWAIRLSKNVMMSLYQNAMKSGGATFKDRENYFKIVNNWNEKLAVEHNVGESLLDILKKGLSKNANINRK